VREREDGLAALDSAKSEALGNSGRDEVNVCNVDVLDRS
jgi:hypothetical protein